DPDAVQAVKFIFKSYAERDISLRELAATLNDKGIASPKGGLWTGTTVRAILTRDTYLGEAVQFRESKGKFYTISSGGVAPANGKSIKPEAEWFKVKCPRIIDRPTWDRCAAKL